MKTLLLVRHAKSSWDNASLKDFDRPLNDRGKKNAPEMASRLVKKKIAIDLFVSSPAKRAKSTAILFAREFKRKEEDIVFEESLYHADSEVFLNVISNLSDKHKSVAIFSHNPGITDFANSITDSRIDNIPTCGVFAIGVDADNWSDFARAEKHLAFFDYPKSEQE